MVRTNLRGGMRGSAKSYVNKGGASKGVCSNPYAQQNSSSRESRSYVNKNSYVPVKKQNVESKAYIQDKGSKTKTELPKGTKIVTLNNGNIWLENGSVREFYTERSGLTLKGVKSAKGVFVYKGKKYYRL